MVVLLIVCVMVFVIVGDDVRLMVYDVGGDEDDEDG